MRSNPNPITPSFAVFSARCGAGMARCKLPKLLTTDVESGVELRQSTPRHKAAK